MLPPLGLARAARAVWRGAAGVRGVGGRALGQPTAETHPHLLQAGHVMPGIGLAALQQRRRSLVQMMQENTVMVVPAYQRKMIAHQIPYLPFRQSANFLYLTGCEEPDAILVLDNLKGEARTHLFVAASDPRKEKWEGPITGPDRAAEYFGVDITYPVEKFVVVTRGLMERAQGAYIDTNANKDVLDSFVAFGQELNLGGRVYAAHTLIEALRFWKSRAELDAMRIAGQISANAFLETMPRVEPGMNEHQLGAMMDFHMRCNGATRTGYPSVVAGGANALVIHYSANNQVLRDGDLVLVDAGAEVAHYNGDITRTWPVNGRFTPAQRRVYEGILEVQKACIEACTPNGKTTLGALHRKSRQMLTELLRDLGILKPDEADDRYFDYYPHSVGHYIGMDVHDTASVEDSHPLEAGMCLTIEPGLYLPHTDAVPPEFRGIGIRIEDDIAIHDSTYEVLTAVAPKEVDEIEELMAVAREGRGKQ